MKIRRMFILILGLTIAAAARSVTENSPKTNLSGTVSDEKRAVITQTEVTLTNKDEKVFRTETGENGEFQIDLNEGRYTIEFYKEGFKRYKIENYRLAFKTKMQFDVSLEVGTTSQPTEVVPIDGKTKNP